MLLLLLFLLNFINYISTKNTVIQYWNDTMQYIPEGTEVTLFKIPKGGKVFYWSLEIKTPGNFEFYVWSSGIYVAKFPKLVYQDRYYSGFTNDLDPKQSYEFIARVPEVTQVTQTQGNGLLFRHTYFAYGDTYENWIMMRDQWPKIPPNMTLQIHRVMPIPPGCQNLTWTIENQVEFTLTVETYKDSSNAYTDIQNGKDKKGVVYPPGKTDGYYELFIGSKPIDFVKVVNNAIGSIGFKKLNFTCFMHPVPPHHGGGGGGGGGGKQSSSSGLQTWEIILIVLSVLFCVCFGGSFLLLCIFGFFFLLLFGGGVVLVILACLFGGTFTTFTSLFSCLISCCGTGMGLFIRRNEETLYDKIGSIQGGVEEDVDIKAPELYF